MELAGSSFPWQEAFQPVTSTNIVSIILCNFTIFCIRTTQIRKPTVFLSLSMDRAQNAINPNLCVVLRMRQSVQLLTIYRVTAYRCTNLLSKASWSPSSQLLQWLQDRQSVQGPEAHGPAEAASNSAKRSCKPVYLSETKIFRFLSKSTNSRVKRQEGGRITSSHKYICSTVLSYIFQLLFALWPLAQEGK